MTGSIGYLSEPSATALARRKAMGLLGVDSSGVETTRCEDVERPDRPEYDFVETS